ncbi:hypothetical protein SAMN03159376_04448 [Pseudomonas sp. NFACC09-4]|nr:hypothetical protein SAMN03159376_04448 [Pseudomonas sp. NFACC09-4]SFX63235.1 hypothetical protein SAMN03159442_02316 [Pseudomonas sp. NFACC47-1]SFX78575.1 hypothetical protein SAMN03159390_02584 [Pseudomonas sp. NFACC49-2]SFX99780.1 hypothetical protein SAMN03159309_03545 [Pseudomonas sp. NFACC36]SFY10960.1 hypothetical protein SAMN03159352_03162 [Pseudomonas sp. NFACC43]SIS25735.1 hypothetical protein SAMN05428955_4074 [Pseudomonas sp. 7SR1]
MMTVYVMVMAICSGKEGCVEERKPGPTYATKEICMETARGMAPRKGVKFKCRRQQVQLIVPNHIPHAAGLENVVSTDTKRQP